MNTIKLNLSAIEDTLSMSEMQEIQAGSISKSSFCRGAATAGIVYQAGVLLNCWNPIGWGGEVALLAVGVYCL